MARDLAKLSALVALRTRAWPLGHWYWGDAIAVDGLLAVAHVDPGPIRGHVLEQLRHGLRSVPAGYHDALAPGATIARLVEDWELPEAAAERFLRALDHLPILYGSVPALEPHLSPYRFGLCIDAVYHLPPALAAIGVGRADQRLLTRAVTVAMEMLDTLRCPGGWALLGALDTLGFARGRVNADRLRELAMEMLTTMGACQQESGHWGSVLGRHDLPLESSVAADGTYRGVSADVLPDWTPLSYEHFEVEPSPCERWER